MSSLATGIREEGWRIDAATGVKRPSELNVGDLIALLSGTYGDRLKYNLLTNKTELDNVVIEDEQKTYFYLSLASIGWKCGKDPSRDSIDFVARSNPYNPVIDYLNQVKGDESIYPTDINSVSKDYLKTEDPLFDRMMKVFLIGAVHRAFHNGSKFDLCLTLKGPQGIGKSSFFKALCPDSNWFTDTPIGKDKDNYLAVNSKWIIELSELETVTTKKSAGEVKAFLSSPEDTYRKPYGRGLVTSKRPSVCCATVNKDEFLIDETGSRRFPVIKCGDEKIDISIIEKDRDSIWKAAVLAYEAGDKPYLSSDDEKLSEIYNQAYKRENIYLIPIASWSRTGLCPGVFTTDQAISGSDIKEKSQIKPADQQLAAAALRELGFVKRQTHLKGIKGYYWSKKDGGVTDVKKHQDNNRTPQIAAKASIVNKLSYVLKEKDENKMTRKEYELKRNSCLLVQPDRTLRTIAEKLKAEERVVSQWEIEEFARHQEFEKEFGIKTD